MPAHSWGQWNRWGGFQLRSHVHILNLIPTFLQFWLLMCIFIPVDKHFSPFHSFNFFYFGEHTWCISILINNWFCKARFLCRLVYYLFWFSVAKTFCILILCLSFVDFEKFLYVKAFVSTCPMVCCFLLSLLTCCFNIVVIVEIMVE